MGWVRANLLTLASVVVVIVITVLLDIPVSIAYPVWFIAFLLDSSYTFLNRRYVYRYELNILVRRSRDLVTAFIKVLCIEYAIIFMLSLLLIDSSGLAVSFMLFAVVHTSAFVRSYMFIRKQFR